MSRLIEASSRKSTLSANSETEPIASRDREFDAEIGEIEQCDHEDGAAQR